MFEFNATFLIAMFSFIVFILIMNAIFYNPILNIIRKRDEYISSNYEDSQRFKNSAQDINLTRNAKLEQTKEECRHEIRIAVEIAHSESSKKIVSARAKSKAEIQAKKDELAQKEEVIKNTIKETVVKNLASNIVYKLLGAETRINKTNLEPVNKVMD